MAYRKKPKTIDPNEVDPSVYYYDEVYDEMKSDEKCSRDGAEKAHDKNKGAKYIQGLKESADLRKLEKDIRKFKSYRRDREQAEADNKLEDEDIYITSSYKKKLKEMKHLEEEKKRQLELEESRSMNFLKSYDDTKSENQKVHTGETRHNKPEVVESKVAESKPVRQDNVKPELLRRQLRTAEERREYIRVVLAKRTVGKLYEEAVQRYLERKAHSQGR